MFTAGSLGNAPNFKAERKQIFFKFGSLAFRYFAGLLPVGETPATLEAVRA